MNIRGVLPPGRVAAGRLEEQWKKPLAGVFWVAVDGAFKGEQAGAGVIIRDETGGVIAVMAVRLHGITEAAHAETLAIWKGIELARELLLPSIIVELDCGLIVRRIKEGKEDLSSLVHIVNSL